jgi:hypothetical protein
VKRRDLFRATLGIAATELVLPYEPKRIYSFGVRGLTLAGPARRL